MYKYLFLLLSTLIVMSCSHNFETISKNPSQLSALKKPINKADIVGNWRAMDLLLPELARSFFDSEKSYESYIEDKAMIDHINFEQEEMTFQLMEDGRIRTYGPKGSSKGTYTFTNNVLKISNEGHSEQEQLEIIYLKNGNAIFRSQQPIKLYEKDDKQITFHLIMKRQ